jgi:glyoxylate reductase
MTTPRALVTHPTIVEAAGPDGVPESLSFDLLDADGERDIARALDGHAGLVCLLTDRIDAAVLAADPQLRVVANVAVGYDNIDIAAARKLGIVVTNTPGVLTHATADLAFALILGTARRLPEGDTYVRTGRWDGFHLLPDMLGADVHGATLGIFGMGRIGREVARRAAHGFDMRVLYHSRRRLPVEQETSLPAEYVDLDRLLAESDFLSIHAPLTPQTYHVIGAPELARMKPTAILINTSRGPLVDEAALADALAAGRIAGAGLDVFEAEPTVHSGLLELRERVVLLPHVGSATATTRRMMATVALANAAAVLRGEPPPNPVPLERV